MMKDIFSAILIPTDDSIPKSSADDIFSGLIDAVFLLAGIVAVIGIILSAFRFVTANGDAGKVTKAKQGLLYSIIGVVVVAVGFGLVRFVIVAISGG